MKRQILQQLSTSIEYLSDFKLSSCVFKRRIPNGWESVQIEAYSRGWDSETDKPALRLYPIYGKRFDVLHKWFEPFSFKTLKDQRSNYTIGFDGKMLNADNYFYFPQDGSRYDERLTLVLCLLLFHRFIISLLSEELFDSKTTQNTEDRTVLHSSDYSGRFFDMNYLCFVLNKRLLHCNKVTSCSYLLFKKRFAKYFRIGSS